MSKAASLAFVVTGCIFACVTPSSAESGYEAWLRYEPAAPETRSLYRDIPKTLVCYGSSELIRSAADELSRGCKSMLGLAIEAAQTPGGQGCLVLGRVELLTNSFRSLSIPGVLQPDSFLLRTVRAGGRTDIFIAGSDDRAVLYGAFAFLRKVALGQRIDPMDETHIPSAPIRVLNHWDNLDGSIERGYAGKSIFWDNDHVSEDLRRLRDYARLMASVGINGCSINNVNADGRMLTPEFLAQVARIASEFRPWGVRVLISIDFAAPRKIGGLTTFDPLDPAVVEFWKRKVDEVYGVVPDLGGFILKADSEGRLGPSAYGRTHADAANMIAAALRPHKGLLFYRGFVYDHHMDWRNLKLDRAKAAYDNFHPLDGRFLDNVVVQIKHGPIDFQVREPVSPLFGALDRTCQAVELQITQEYTGQQRHLCYLVPMWKQVLDFDLHANGSETPVKSIVAGKTFKRATGGFVGVSNVGRDTNWLGHDLAVANLYGFGRLAWNPDLSPKQIAEEWARLTFGADPVVNQTVVRLEIDSWPAYESYTGPLGAGTLTDILGPHYGPGVESSERNGWGQWHRADAQGVGMDRTVATGTQFIGQYSTPVAATFESLQNCPDEVLLFMHHVPYTQVLHSGKTVIQHIYDSHYSGALQAAGFVDQWLSLKGRIDTERFERVLQRLQYQAGHAIVWRDAVNNWFLKTSAIPDQEGRAGRFPNRFEAEQMDLRGYSVVQVTPWETASGGNAVEISSEDGRGSASFHFPGKPGPYDIAVQYFDLAEGVSSFRVSVGGREVDHWIGDASLPGNRPNGHNSTRHTIPQIHLSSGDEIRIEGVAQRADRACIDYIEITPRAE